MSQGSSKYPSHFYSSAPQLFIEHLPVPRAHLTLWSLEPRFCKRELTPRSVSQQGVPTVGIESGNLSFRCLAGCVPTLPCCPCLPVMVRPHIAPQHPPSVANSRFTEMREEQVRKLYETGSRCFTPSFVSPFPTPLPPSSSPANAISSSRLSCCLVQAASSPLLPSPALPCPSLPFPTRHLSGCSHWP